MTPCAFAENAPGAYGWQWLCLTGPRFTVVERLDDQDKRANTRRRKSTLPAVPAGYMTVVEAARRSGMPRGSIFARIERGQIDGVKVGRCWFCKLESVLAYEGGKVGRPRKVGA